MSNLNIACITEFIEKKKENLKMSDAIDNKEPKMSIEIPKITKATNAQADKWLENLDPFDKAAFSHSLNEDERRLAENRVNGPIVTSSASQFETDAERVVEEEAIRGLAKPVTQTPNEPAGHTSADATNLEPAKA